MTELYIVLVMLVLLGFLFLSRAIRHRMGEEEPTEDFNDMEDNHEVSEVSASLSDSKRRLH